jgi:hypothetical protein
VNAGRRKAGELVRAGVKRHDGGHGRVVVVAWTVKRPVGRVLPGLQLGWKVWKLGDDKDSGKG